jgi:hypothetical protein
MLGTNGQFQSILCQIDSQIGALERAVADGETPGRAAPALEALWARRRALKLLLLNRQVEAARKVVDFRRWCDGNGAIYLCAPPPSRPKRARA